jgi:hypothetical protein
MWPITRYSLRAVQHDARARAHDLRTPKHEQGLYAMAMDVGVTDTAPTPKGVRSAPASGVVAESAADSVVLGLLLARSCAVCGLVCWCLQGALVLGGLGWLRGSYV